MCQGRAGNVNTGAASVISPTVATPRAGRLRANEAVTPAARTRKAPGSDRRRLSNISATKASAPVARLAGCQVGALAASPLIRRHRSVAGTGTPTMTGSCLRIMVAAKPKAKPRSTGREMKADSAPSLSAAAMRKAPTMATTTVAIAKRMAVSGDIAASDAPRIAAEDDVGATIAKRLLPCRRSLERPDEGFSRKTRPWCLVTDAVANNNFVDQKCSPARNGPTRIPAVIR